MTTEQLEAIRKRSSATSGNWLADYLKLQSAQIVLTDDVPALIDEVERLQTEVSVYRQRELDQLYGEWNALVYGEFEEYGVTLTKHEHVGNNGWYANYDVEFDFFGKSYGFKYRKHTSSNVCDSDITEGLREINGGDS